MKETLEDKEFRTKATKDWCEDIMKKYLAYWSVNDEIYKNLKKFYEENIVNTNSTMSQADKETWLSKVAIEINDMYLEMVAKEKLIKYYGYEKGK
jgi:hypothetical protein